MSVLSRILAPVRIFEDNTQEEKGSDARLSSFAGAYAIGNLLKTTLGPKGMDKIIIATRPDVEGQLKTTNDGATILRSIGIDNPAAKVLVEMSLVQDSEVGDGTTTVVLLAVALLKEAEKLVTDSHVHPQTIIAGWRKALEISREELSNLARISESDAKHFRSDLQKIAETTLGSKILAGDKEHFAKIAVDAVLRTKGSGDLSSIVVIKILGGRLADSYLDDGFLLEKKPGMYQPNRIEKARILIANTGLDADKIKVYSATVKVASVAKLAELETAEKQRMKEKIDKIVAHDINVFINRQLIYNYPEQLFADAKVMAVEHADFEGIEQLALVLGGDIVSTFDNPKKNKLGRCDLIELVDINEKTFLRFSGVPLGAACSVVLFGATEQILDEAKRSLHDVLCVLMTHIKEAKVIHGGGCSEIAMANAVYNVASRTSGKQSLAMEAFARALNSIPETLADNGGFDSAELVSQLRAAHSRGLKTYGIDMDEGCIADMTSMGVFESYRVKLAALNAAAEVAEMLLRVDAIVTAEPRKRVVDNRPC